ncbi:MAG: lambda exonuclease family protein [Nanoarchaeota archaeon]
MKELVQQSEEWLEFRRSRIGASDAPIIMGVSPWKTPYKLWVEKISNTNNTYVNKSMSRGIELEEDARKLFQEMSGFIVKPDVRVHPEYDWMIASLDGIDESKKIIVEIKCPNTVDHSLAKNGEIPKKYIPQLQHQMEVCQVDMAYYFSFDGKQGVIVNVHRDENYIKNLMFKEKEFYSCMQNFISPESNNTDYRIVNDEVTSYIANRLVQIKKNLKDLSNEEEDLKKNLIFMCGMENTKGKQFKLTKTYRKGSIDYRSIPELENVDLEKYRSNPIEIWRISND